MKGNFKFEGKRDPILEKILEEIDIVAKLYFGDDPEDISPEDMTYVVTHLRENTYSVKTEPTGFAIHAQGYHCNDNNPKIIDKFSWPCSLTLTVRECERQYEIIFNHCE